jgi:hypothetical protein
MVDVSHLDSQISVCPRLVFEFEKPRTWTQDWKRLGVWTDWACQSRVAYKWNSVDPLPRQATVALAATMLSVRASHQARSRLAVNRPQLFSPSIVRGRIDHRHR